MAAPSGARLLAGLQGLLLLRRDQSFRFLAGLLVNLADSLSLLLHREGRIGAHRLHLSVRILLDLPPPVHRRL